jgi:hypothetical protein
MVPARTRWIWTSSALDALPTLARLGPVAWSKASSSERSIAGVDGGASDWPWTALAAAGEKGDGIGPLPPPPLLEVRVRRLAKGEMWVDTSSAGARSVVSPEETETSATTRGRTHQNGRRGGDVPLTGSRTGVSATAGCETLCEKTGSAS